MKFSIVTSTHNINSHENLFSSLHTWINLKFKEIIIVDWCSDIKFEHVLPSYFKTHENFNKIKIFYIRGYDKYISTWAYNFGISLADSEYILKLDPEFEINSEFLNINNFDHEEPCLYLDQNQFLCKKIYLEKIGYFDEKILNNSYCIPDLICRFVKEYTNSFTIKELIGINNILDTNEIIILPIQYKKEDDIYYLDSVSKNYSQQNLNLEKRFIILKVYNGIGNRFKTLFTTIHFAQKYNYKLFVIWEKTQGFSDSKFEEFFNYTGDKNFEFIRSDDIKNIVFDYTYFFKQDNQNVKKFDLSYNKIYVETYYQLEILFSLSPPSQNIKDEDKILYKNIKPTRKVKIVLEYIKKYILNNKYSKYNIYHIRRGDATNKFNKDRDNTYIWSSIYMFAKYINMHSEKQNLVLTDDYEYCKKFLDILCTNKYITINETNLNRNVLHIDSKIFTIQDVVDLFLFENAEKVFETYWSTFSDTGVMMFDIKDKETVVDKNLYLGIKHEDLEYSLQNDIISNYIPYCTFSCKYNNLYSYLNSNYTFKVIILKSLFDKYETIKNLKNIKEFENKINILILDDINKNNLNDTTFNIEKLKKVLENTKEKPNINDSYLKEHFINYQEFEKYIISSIYKAFYS